MADVNKPLHDTSLSLFLVIAKLKEEAIVHKGLPGNVSAAEKGPDTKH